MEGYDPGAGHIGLRQKESRPKAAEDKSYWGIWGPQMAAKRETMIKPATNAAQPIGVATMMEAMDFMAVIFVAPRSAVAPWLLV